MKDDVLSQKILTKKVVSVAFKENSKACKAVGHMWLKCVVGNNSLFI